MRKQPNTTNLTFICQDVVAFGLYDDTICFVNIVDGQSNFYRLLDQNFDGIRVERISCITGHRFQSIFAFSDVSLAPHIIVLTYPDLRCIATLQSN